MTKVDHFGNFKKDSADPCGGKFPLVSMGGRAEGLACADPGARTPIGAKGNFYQTNNLSEQKCIESQSLAQFLILEPNSSIVLVPKGLNEK